MLLPMVDAVPWGSEIRLERKTSMTYGAAVMAVAQAMSIRRMRPYSVIGRMMECFLGHWTLERHD